MGSPRHTALLRAGFVLPRPRISLPPHLRVAHYHRRRDLPRAPRVPRSNLGQVGRDAAVLLQRGLGPGQRSCALPSPVCGTGFVLHVYDGVASEAATRCGGSR